MGQWETFEIAEKDQVVKKKTNEEGFGGFADCLIDDAMMFPGEKESKGIVGSAAAFKSPTMHQKASNGSELDEGEDSEDITPVKKAGLQRQSSAAMSETETDNDLEESYEEPDPLLFSESWQAKEARIREQSSYGHLPGWR